MLSADELEEILRLTIVDSDFRDEFISKQTDYLDIKDFLPEAVAQKDLTFIELISDVDIANCSNTCVTGLTLRCDGTTIESSTSCRCTCISGYTVSCDGRTL